MKGLVKKICCGIAALLLMAVISFAALNDGVIYDTIPSGKPMLDIMGSIDTSYSMLKKNYGENKEIPPGYEKQVLFALSYFPELVHTHIVFSIEKSNSGIISTRPFYSSLLKRSSRRSYLVVINDSAKGRTFPTWLQCEVNGQVGILGHELSHIIYFSKQTGLGLLGLGVAHISTRFMDRFENKTDSVDIERGLGYQLIAWNEYLGKTFKHMHPDNLRERYMSIAHIRRVMAKSKVYSQLAQ